MSFPTSLPSALGMWVPAGQALGKYVLKILKMCIFSIEIVIMQVQIFNKILFYAHFLPLFSKDLFASVVLKHSGPLKRIHRFLEMGDNNWTLEFPIDNQSLCERVCMCVHLIICQITGKIWRRQGITLFPIGLILFLPIWYVCAQRGCSSNTKTEGRI